MTTSAPAPTSVHGLTTSIQPDMLMGAFTQLLLVQPGHVMPGQKKLSNCGRAQARWLGQKALIDVNLILRANDPIAEETMSEIMFESRRMECDQCFVAELDFPNHDTHPLSVMLGRLGNAPLQRSGKEGRSFFGQPEALILKRWGLEILEVIMRKNSDKCDIWGLVAPKHVVGVQILAWTINEIIGERNSGYKENKSLIESILLKCGEALRLEFLQDTEPYGMRVVLLSPPGAC